LNKTFYSRYLPVRIVTVSGKTQRRDDEILFCPGPLLSVRYPGLVSPEYRYDFISYQYFVMPDRTANGTNTANWKHERNGQQFQPNLASLQSIPPGRWGIYSCMTLSRTPTTNTTWLGHDAPETRAAPTGMNAAFADGSAGWVALSDTEAYWQQSPTSQQWYWPKPQD
jgi:prepilin-type processing-associated H-X9-DG protein